MSLVNFDKIRAISLKWKLLIPFLLLAFTGTTVLVLVGLTSQERLIAREERREIVYYYQQFLEQINQKKTLSLSLASMAAENPQAREMLAHKNRRGLLELFGPTYESLKRAYKINQFHFHLPGGVSFLRLHRPEQYGDDLSGSRKTILDVQQQGEAVAGLERGAAGFGIRGVAPLFYRGAFVGTVEIGHSFGKDFLKDFQRSWGIDIALYETRTSSTDRLIARAAKDLKDPLADPVRMGVGSGEMTIFIAPKAFSDRTILFGPIKDYSGRVVAVVEINVDRSEIQKRLLQTRNLMILVGVAGIAVSFLLTYVVTILFIKPIKEIVGEAQDIARGERESQLEPRPNDEIGTLTRALNMMLKVLQERRLEIERYASGLERRVDERTADLVASEEKYRALVENVPLIVYRILRDGTTEFINTAMTEILGYTIEEAVRDRQFWKEKICGIDQTSCEDIFKACFDDGDEYRIERQVTDKNGRILTFIDHAIPAYNNGNIRWVDGIMMDITELKRLQERALHTEEIRILGEISAHLAHEIRNPLSAAGGFARRLRDSLAEDDPHRKLAGIIVEEISRLEAFLKTLLESIRPFDLALKMIDLKQLVRGLTQELSARLPSRQITFEGDYPDDLPMIEADDEKLRQALEHILKHAMVSTPNGKTIFLSMGRLDDRILITIRHEVRRLSEDDLDKFFFPHIEAEREWTILDLPLSKIIIHRHGGKVDLRRETENILMMRMELPIRQKKED